MKNERQDVYIRVISKIIADPEQGVRTWMKPWNAGNTSERISLAVPAFAQDAQLDLGQKPTTV